MKKIIAVLIIILFPVLCLAGSLQKKQCSVIERKNAVVTCETETTPSDMKTSASAYQVVANASSVKYVSSAFVGDATSGTVCKVCVTLTKILSPTMTFTVAIWSDDGSGPPSKPLAELNNFGGMSSADITGEHCFTTGSVAIANATKYHVVIASSATDASNYFRWTKDSSAVTTLTNRSADGASWTALETDRCYMTKLYKQ